MDADLLAALPTPAATALEAGELLSVGGTYVGSMTMRQHRETPESGRGAIQRWLDLYDHANWLIGEPDPHDSRPQRTASQAIDSLFRYEHQMTPQARRQAREALWQRDRPNDPLPTAPHVAGEAPAGCHCSACRSEWERCRCRPCRLARLLHRPMPL